MAAAAAAAGKSLTDCPSNLKEAIDWILRVTGKDGGGGGGNEQKLAEAITKLPGFTDAIDAAAKKLTESGSDAWILYTLAVPRTLWNPYTFF
ncbi:spectrin repeat superfamily Extracellular matrix-binding protein, putative [Babesia caballi]|uniref:Spectrin repeat superfamily Extracellular matrix-binding protein, putative n=1 Tax=Babesia caballi TaxID=5871 RepID=A0AAV4M3D9_BABCB|nr:spectrin repeat superfamily Extracellular matrix-binding protein, putative [Babesia caballi]